MSGAEGGAHVAELDATDLARLRALCDDPAGVTHPRPWHTGYPAEAGRTIVDAAGYAVAFGCDPYAASLAVAAVNVLPALLAALADARREHDAAARCNAELARRASTLEGAIRHHRDQRGHDRCWLDDTELYAVLPDVDTSDQRLPPREEFLAGCARYYELRRTGECPAGTDGVADRLAAVIAERDAAGAQLADVNAALVAAERELDRLRPVAAAARAFQLAVTAEYVAEELMDEARGAARRAPSADAEVASSRATAAWDDAWDDVARANDALTAALAAADAAADGAEGGSDGDG